MKQRLFTGLFILFQAINLTAQIDTSFFYKYKEPNRYGVKQTLNVHYDGDNLFMFVTLQGMDTCSYLNQTITDLQNRISHVYNLGHVYHDGERHDMYNGNSESDIKKTRNYVTYVYKLNRIPIVINGLDTLDFRIADHMVDSVIFTCKGKEPFAYAKPTPIVFTKDTLIWQKKNLLHGEDTLIFKIFFEGTNKGFLAWSKFTLQEKNRQADLFDVLKSLMYALPFWLLFLLLLKNKEVFGSNQGIVDQITKWVPVLSGLYFVVFFSEIFEPFDRIEIGMTLQDESDLIVRNRFILLGVSVLSLISQFFVFRKSKSTIGLFNKKLLMVIAVSGIILVALGLINYAIETLFFHVDKKNLGESMKLQVRMDSFAFIGTLGGLFILFCFYRLFSFNRRYQLIATASALFFLVLRIIVFFPEPSPPPSPDGSRSTVEFFLRTVFLEYEILFLLPLFLFLTILDKIQDGSFKKTTLFFNGAFLFIFCCYATSGLFDRFFGIPITLIVAFILGRYLLLSDLKSKVYLLKKIKPLFELDKMDRKIFTKTFELKQFEKLKEKYNDKLLKGELLPAEFDKANADLEHKINEAVPDGVDRLLIHRRMEFPIFENNLKNSERASTYGMVVSFLFLLLFYWAGNNSGGDTLDTLFFDILIPCVMYTVASFCLGYFFIYLRGNTGWKKGFWIGLSMAVAHLPYQYLISGKLTLMFFLTPIMQEVLIMTLTGFLAFDYSIIKKIYGKGLSFKHLAQIEGVRNLAWFGTVILSAIGAAITAWLTGNFSSILENAAK